MAKNPFKKQSIMDTVVNVGIGGAANVAIDAVVNQFDAIKGLGDTTVNAAKIALGAVLGSMVSNQYLRAACDGVATVGVANLIAGLMEDSSTPTPTPGGEGAGSLPYGTISGRRLGNRAYRRAHKVSGCDATAVMGK